MSRWLVIIALLVFSALLARPLAIAHPAAALQRFSVGAPGG